MRKSAEKEPHRDRAALWWEMEGEPSRLLLLQLEHFLILVVDEGGCRKGSNLTVPCAS